MTTENQIDLGEPGIRTRQIMRAWREDYRCTGPFPGTREYKAVFYRKNVATVDAFFVAPDAEVLGYANRRARFHGPKSHYDAVDEIDWTDLLSAPQKVRKMGYDVMAASSEEYVHREALVANVAQSDVERPCLKRRTPSLLTGTSRIYLTKSANARIRPRLLTPLAHLHVMGHPVYSDRWLLKARQHCLTDAEKCHLAGNAFCVQLIGRVILWFLSCTGKCEE